MSKEGRRYVRSTSNVVGGSGFPTPRANFRGVRPRPPSGPPHDEAHPPGGPKRTPPGGLVHDRTRGDRLVAPFYTAVFFVRNAQNRRLIKTGGVSWTKPSLQPEKNGAPTNDECAHAAFRGVCDRIRPRDDAAGCDPRELPATSHRNDERRSEGARGLRGSRRGICT